MGVLGIACTIMGLLDLRTKLMGNLRSVGLSDVVWPNNPYAYYRFWKQMSFQSGASAYTIFLYSFALLMTLFCIVDFCLWILMAIKTPYGVLTGTELLKRKLSPKHDGFISLVRFWSGFWVALKFMRTRDVLNYFIQFRYQVYVFMVFSLVGLVIVCHYMARAMHYFAFLHWVAGENEIGMCDAMFLEWGKTDKDVDDDVRDICVHGLTSVVGIPAESCEVENRRKVVKDNLGVVVRYYREADKLSFMRFSNYRQYDLFLRSMHYLCQQDWETELSFNGYTLSENKYYNFHLRYMLALFSIASTEGSDVIAYVPSAPDYYTVFLITIVTGMFVLAFVSAKGTLHW